MIDESRIDSILARLNGAITTPQGTPYIIDKQQQAEIKGMFKSLMQENKNKNLSNINQETLLEGIVEDFANGSDYYQAFNFRSDNQHMSGYDAFLQDGEGKRIIEILKSYGIGSDVLKGVPLPQEFNGSLGNGITVKEEIDKPNDESPYIKLFEIRLNGEIIYQWKGRAYGQGDVYEKINKEQTDIVQPKTKSKYEGSAITNDGEYPIKKWTNRKGQTFYTQGKIRIKKEIAERYF